MQLIPKDEMPIWVGPDGMVIVGAHEHNGYIWWTRLPDPLQDPVIRRELKLDVVDPPGSAETEADPLKGTTGELVISSLSDAEADRPCRFDVLPMPELPIKNRG
jgi:hypothetical protein